MTFNTHELKHFLTSEELDSAKQLISACRCEAVSSVRSNMINESKTGGGGLTNLYDVEESLTKIIFKKESAGNRTSTTRLNATNKLINYLKNRITKEK